MPSKPKPPARPMRLLLLIPILAVLVLPIFNRTMPALWGFPFFYWYQMLWVILCAGIVGLVFLGERHDDMVEDDA